MLEPGEQLVIATPASDGPSLGLAFVVPIAIYGGIEIILAFKGMELGTRAYLVLVGIPLFAMIAAKSPYVIAVTDQRVLLARVTYVKYTVKGPLIAAPRGSVRIDIGREAFSEVAFIVRFPWGGVFRLHALRPYKPDLGQVAGLAGGLSPPRS